MTRAEAIKKMQAVKAYMISGNPIWSITEMGETFDMAIEALEQSERKTGKWIDYTDEGYVECPFCHSATNCEGDKEELYYCFSCGADMRQREDGNV